MFRARRRSNNEIPRRAANAVAHHEEVDERIIVTGTYTGDDTLDRQITIGFKCSMVILINATDPRLWVVIPNRAYTDTLVSTSIRLHATDGFRVKLSAAPDLGNDLNDVFYYWSISE